MKLEGKVAIVTGSGRGIGKAIALAFAGEGAPVILVSRTISELETVASEIETMGGEALAIRADVSNHRDIEEMARKGIDRFGKIDILVNNAGVLGPIGPVWENDVGEWLKAVHINLFGAFLCSRAVLPHMIKQRWGRIINLSGGGAAYGRPFFSAYASSKAALVRFTECLALEVKDYNITVNAIAPGLVNTRMQDEVLRAGAKAGEEALTQARKAKEESLSPNLATSLAVFLASDESSHLTGRLISALWDDWRNFPSRLREIEEKELFTLRRIDGVSFKPSRRG